MEPELLMPHDPLTGIANGSMLSSQSPPPLDSSIEDIDELCLDQELENLDDIPCPPTKHFLDYDSIPPPGFEDDEECSSTVAVKGVPKNVYPNENRKVDKKYETDGEISDFELAASNVMKTQRKEKNVSTDVTQKQQPLFVKNTGARRKKHFLDENPIPPDYEMDREREHRSLDRNFERTKDYDIKYERKHSLDRERPKRLRETSFTMARFLEHDPSPIYRGTWPADRPNDTQYSPNFTSMPPGELKHLGPMGPKVECVYSLLSMLGCNDQLEMSSKFLELSKTAETCAALRHSRCIPLIVQMIHSDADEQTRKRATQALHNVVNCHPDDKAGRREAKVLRHIEQIMEYCEMLKNLLTKGETMADDGDRHPSQAIFSLMKISFDEEHRHAMCQLGALQAIASMVHYDHAVHGHNSMDERCISLRRYAGMALTNLTFGDGNNKALLCTNKEFMKALVAQLNSTADDLLQVTASVLRNLSWRADNTMKTVLNEIGTVTALSHAVMKNKNENTIKSLLSALWNLSAHCSTNKAEFCAVDGALAFLVDMLVYEGPSKTLTIIENAGGILRNVSSHIAVKESYRIILRQRNCLGILLQQLASESLTIVSNACGTLWNLSARCQEDQEFLLKNKAVQMLGLLIHSKHKMISNGSNAALKNLLNCRSAAMAHSSLDPVAKSMRLKELPSLNVRKQRALEQDLDQNLSETCENIEVTTPPKEQKTIDDFLKLDQNYQQTTSSRLIKSTVSKSESKESTVSAAKPDVDFNKQRRGMHGIASTSSAKSKEDDATRPITSDVPTPAPRRSVKKSDETFNTTTEGASSSSASPTAYQETDLDQITDFSLRYGEHQNEESDADETKPANSTDAYGNEILLILEDSVKCYETEGTPYVISNAASVSDLRAGAGGGSGPSRSKTTGPTEIKNKIVKSGHVTIDNSGINTPEKTTNYCEEGTPGYSIYDSYSSLDENADGAISAPELKDQPPQHCPAVFNETIREVINEDEIVPIERDVYAHDEGMESGGETNPTTPGGSNAKVVTFETPMMFSRQSSLGSLSSAEPAMADDRSSVVSDFSRLASGIMSPSEIPDSPSQMIPHSPRRSAGGGGSGGSSSFPTTPPIFHHGNVPTSRLRSVFEDDMIHTFDVENTPAQFSCATSLSNLSLDDEPKIATDSLTKEMRLLNHPSEDQEEGEEQGPIEQTLHSTVFINNTNGTVGTTSDSDETDDDNMLLATCINIGMNSGVRVPQKQKSAQDATSPINISTRIVTGTDSVHEQQQTNTVSDDSTSSSDMGNESLLEQCIREGIQRSTTSKPKITPARTECRPDNQLDGLILESVASGTSESSLSAGRIRSSRPTPQVQHDDSLSSLSMDSEDDGLILRQAIAAGSKAKPKVPTIPKATVSTSLSHQQISSSSPLLQHASTSQYPISARSTTQHYVPSQMALDGNDSLSSIDSTDSNDTQHASLLEQCIQSGMHKTAVKDKPATKPRSMITDKPAKLTVSSPKRSQLPTFKSPSQIERDRQKERERQDEALLMECIQTGMSKGNTGSNRTDSQIKPPARHVRQVLAPTDYTQRLANLNIHDAVHHNLSKNGETTSVAVSDTIVASAPYTASGVVETKVPPEGTNESKGVQQRQYTSQHTTRTGFSPIGNEHINPLQLSYGSLNLSNEGNSGLDRSNEYPAMKLSNIEYTTDSYSSQHESSLEMEVSNEFMMEQYEEPPKTVSTKVDKHKDPDLMLKSVDRLTQELVSTAEYLRTATASNSEAETTVYERKSSSNSNNTWNEDTCPNDASFPSISMTAPMIASMNDDDATLSDVYLGRMDLNKSDICEEPTPTNETRSFIVDGRYQETVYGASYDTDIGCTSQPDSLDTDTKTIVNDDSSTGSQINFHVGGEVQHTFRDNIPNYLSSGPFSFDASSAMTNSTIIALEANKLVTELLNMKTMADSSTSLDLDHIRPPSGMDTVSISNFFEGGATYSPQLPRSRKKSLPLGLIARRALSHAAPSGSLESVNSSCNLDNIKPPSIMDELLDSMISVASITSEVVENQSSHLDHSTYDTAMSEIDDTTTLRSCYDLPNDATPIPSDFSSAESTPRKIRGIKRTLTPKQKRQIVKERYRTYTIAADMMLNDTIDEFRSCSEIDEAAAMMNGSQRMDGDGADAAVAEDMIQIEIVEDSKRVTPRQRRIEDRTRFQTQTLDSANFIKNNGSIIAVDSNQPIFHRNHNEILDRYRSRALSSQDEEGDLQKFFVTTTRNDTPEKANSNICKFNDTSSDSNSLDDDADMSSIRALTARFKYIRDANIGNAPCNAAKAASTKLPVIMCTTTTTASHRDVDLSSLDFEQNSETESCYQNHCIDEETYTVSPKFKPKIVKPSVRPVNGNDISKDSYVTPTPAASESNGNTPPEIKIVRGKKKAPYVSPYKKTSSTTRLVTPPKSSLPLKNQPTDLKKTSIAKLLPRNQTIVAKTHVLISKSNLTNKMNTARSGIAKPGFSNAKTTVSDRNLLNKSNKIKTEITKPAAKLQQNAKTSTPQMPERQGTFVKDEPSNADVPIVTSAPPSPARSKLPSKLPASTAGPPTSPARNSSLMSKIKNPLQRSASIGGTKSSSPKVMGPIRPATTPTQTGAGFNDVQKRRTTAGAFYRSPSTPSVPQRSNSNASIKSIITAKREPFSTQPPSRSNSNLTPPPAPAKKDITSRIAGLWKKQDTATTVSPKAGPASKQPTSNGKPPSGNRLIRSSTFDNTPNKIAVNNKVNQVVESKTTTMTTAGRQPTGNGVAKESNGVIRRIKSVVKSAPVDETKRISRLGSFINVDESTA